MRITRALITAASPAQKTLPLQRLVDRDGTAKTVLQIIVAEARNAGIEHIVIVKIIQNRVGDLTAGVIVFNQ